jgi:hypothetical protein
MISELNAASNCRDAFQGCFRLWALSQLRVEAEEMLGQHSISLNDFSCPSGFTILMGASQNGLIPYVAC